jgi:uncharacterized protein YdaU (DUF1376 family)
MTSLSTCLTSKFCSMAKDPAFLFYPGDWLQGTMGMTFEEKGAYFELLIFQFNNGKFSKASAKQVLSICSASVFEKVIQKFDTDGTLFWKQRLIDEIERRKKFSESRRNNAKGIKNTEKFSKAYAKHMETETETEIETKDNWIEWGKLIVQNNDQHWDAMRGRRVTQDEMDAFLSVATRNKWTMKSQNEFRISLKGFSANGKVNGTGKNPSKIH